MLKQKLDLAGITPLNRMQIEHLAHLAGRFSARILLEHKTRTINGKSMLGLLSLGRTEHEPVTVTADGPDEEEAIREITRLLDSGVAPPKDAADARELVRRIKDRYTTLLRENLAGIYLHGSLAAGCFQWERSDIDFLVVVRQPLPVEKKIALVETLYALLPDAPPEGFDMCVMLERSCRNIPYPVPYELRYSTRWQRDYERNPRGFCERMNGENGDLAVHILCLHAFGETVAGPSVPRAFDQVRREDARSAILDDLADAGEYLHERPVHYVLNLCRALAYFREGAVLSKKEGGEWALNHLAHDHQRVIQAALNAYETGRDMFYDPGQAEDLCYEVMEELTR